MRDPLLAVFFFVFGLAMTFFHKKFGNFASAFQYKIFGLRYKPKGFQIGYLLGGVAFMVFSLLIAAKVISIKR